MILAPSLIHPDILPIIDWCWFAFDNVFTVQFLVSEVILIEHLVICVFPGLIGYSAITSIEIIIKMQKMLSSRKVNFLILLFCKLRTLVVKWKQIIVIIGLKLVNSFRMSFSQCWILFSINPSKIKEYKLKIIKLSWKINGLSR